jgi:hypothetical protein
MPVSPGLVVVFLAYYDALISACERCDSGERLSAEQACTALCVAVNLSCIWLPVALHNWRMV